MYRKSLIPFAFLFAIALLAAPQTARADGNPSAAGAGRYTGSGGFGGEWTFSFNAVLLEDDSVVGHAVFERTDLGVRFRVHVDIDCVAFQGGDHATVSGVITKFQSDLPEQEAALEGWHLVFTVQDLGEGPGVTDRISFHRFIPPGEPVDCHALFLPATHEVVRGNIQVRPE